MNDINSVVVAIPHGLGKSFRKQMDRNYTHWRDMVCINGDRGFPERGNPGYETHYVPMKMAQHLGWRFRFRRWLWKIRFYKYSWELRNYS